MKRVKLYLSEFQLKDVKKVIKKIDMNMSEFVRRAIEEYLDKIKEKYNINT